MAKRVSDQTIEIGVRKLLPASAPAILSAASAVPLAELRDRIPAIDKACRDLKDGAYVHRSVAAVYCRRSEPAIDKHLAKIRKGPQFQSAMVQRRSNEAKGGARAPVYFRVDLLKLIEASIRNAKDEGEDARSRKALQRRASRVHSTTDNTALGDATDTEQLWLTDPQGRIYIRVSLIDLKGRLRLANVFRDGGRIEVLTFQQAVVERDWVDIATHRGYRSAYVYLLRKELRRVARHGQASDARWQQQRLENAVKLPTGQRKVSAKNRL